MENITDSGLKRRVKIHVSAREHVYFAVVQPGFEHTLAMEMRSAELNVCPGFIEGGVEFTGRTDDLFRACLSLRGASRIVMRLGTFRSSTFHGLEKEASEFPWELYLPCNCSPVFRTTTIKSMIWHTGKLESILSGAITRRMSQHSKPEFFASPAPGIAQTLVIRNHRDRCSVSLDTSGALLHKRSGEKLVTSAPLRETSAALILLEAGIHEYDVLVDPMCGSGTFSIEAAGIFSGSLSVPEREFPFFAWPCFRRSRFEYMKKTIPHRGTGLEGKSIVTFDIDPRAVEVAAGNVPEEFRGLVRPEPGDFFSLKMDNLTGKKAFVVINPPYGKRIDAGDTFDLYKRIGEKLRGELAGCGFAVIVPGVDAERALNCRYDNKVLFMNGGIRVAVVFRKSDQQ